MGELRMIETQRRVSFVRRFLVAAVLAGLTGCSPQKPGLEITIEWKQPKPIVQVGTPIQYSGLIIGRVLEVLPASDSGTSVKADIASKYSHYIREKTTFVVRQQLATNIFIEAISVELEALPVASGVVLRGSDSDIEVQFKTLTTDWRRTAIYVSVALALLIVLLVLLRVLFKNWVLFFSIAGGIASAVYATPTVQKFLGPYVPAEVRLDIVSYAVAFVAGFILCMFVLGMVGFRSRSRAPGREEER
jgi:hypothetical protein